MSSATIGIRELRDGLSRHIADVRRGLEITVTDHGKPVARITSVGAESGLEALLREGIARAPLTERRPLPQLIDTDGSVSDLIAEQRR